MKEKKEKRAYPVVMPKVQHQNLKTLSELSGYSMNTLILFGIELILRKEETDGKIIWIYKRNFHNTKRWKRASTH